MRLGECYVARTLRRIVAGDHVRGEGEGAALIPLLFVPGQAPPVSFQAGHYVVQAVAVHVIDAQLRAPGTRAGAGPAPEHHGMIRPEPGSRALCRLLPPTIRRDDIHAPVTVDVPRADSVLRYDTIAGFRNRMHNPRRRRVCGVGAGPADRSSTQKHSVRLS